jgi:serine/threonine protein kinase
MHRIGEIIDGRYQLTRPLGLRRGAEMWEAEHKVAGHRVTLKVVSSDTGPSTEAQKRFVAEARAAAEIGHPGAVEVYDVGVTAQGTAYLVTEPLRGETLADIVGRQGAIEADDACQIARQILAALEAAHRARIVHGHLRAEDVILRRDPSGQLTVKLLDFGLSTELDLGPHAGEAPALSRLDPRLDVQAVGVILYEMLTGRCAGSNGSRMPQAGGGGVQGTAQELVPAIPAALARIVDQAQHGSKRLASVSELARQLEPFAVSERPPSVAPRDTLMPFLSPEARRSRGMARLERAVLGLSEPRDKASIRPNLVLIEGAGERTPRPVVSERTSEAPRQLNAQELMQPRIPRPPRSPKHLASHMPTAAVAISESPGTGVRARRQPSLPLRRWRAARVEGAAVAAAGPAPAATVKQSSAWQPLALGVGWAALLAIAGVCLGLVLARLLHL